MDTTSHDSLARLGVYTSLGIFYGSALALMGAWAVAGGDGTYLPLMVYSSPLGVLGPAAMLYGTPLLWGCVGLLLFGFHGRIARWMLAALLCSHYGVYLVMLYNPGIVDWEYFYRIWNSHSVFLVCSGVIYVTGQIILCGMLIRAFFQARFQFSLRSIFVGMLIIAVLASWIATILLRSQTEQCVMEELDSRCSYRLRNGHVVEVSLNSTDVPAKDLKRLASLPVVEWLDLSYCGITDEKMQFLEGFDSLLFLGMAGNPVRDKSLASLRNCKRLQVLTLSCTEVSDKGLVHLHPLSTLERISLVDTDVTEDGEARLKREIPGILIER